MIKEDVLAAIQANVPDGAEMVIFDHLKNMWDDGGDGSSAGMYYNFEIVTHTPEEIADGCLNVSSIVFTNEDYEDEGEMGILLSERRGREYQPPSEDLVKDMEAAITSSIENSSARGIEIFTLSIEETVAILSKVASDHYSPKILSLEEEVKRLRKEMQEAADHLFNMPTECLLDAKAVIGRANIILSKALNSNS